MPPWVEAALRSAGGRFSGAGAASATGEAQCYARQQAGATGQQLVGPVSIRRSVLVHELPLSFGSENGFQVIVWVADRIARRAVADFEVEDLFIGSVDELVSISRACSETSAHARLQGGFAVVGDEDWAACQDVQELVLSGVRMTQRGADAGGKVSQSPCAAGAAPRLPGGTMTNKGVSR